MKDKLKRLPDDIELSIGMKVMVVVNIATEADIANGTWGTIVDMLLDPRENPFSVDVQEADVEHEPVTLAYPPSVIFFKPDVLSKIKFAGVPTGVVPISPMTLDMALKVNDKTIRISRRQLAITAAYTFTDYKSQGQTIERVIVDLAKLPGKGLSPFNAYVALSCSRGRDTIHLLRPFDQQLLGQHPSEDLFIEDIRLEQLNKLTN